MHWTYNQKTHLSKLKRAARARAKLLLKSRQQGILTESEYAEFMQWPSPKGSEFILHGGRKVHSLKQLADCFGNMPETEFRHHVNNQKNDFFTWVFDIYEEPCLAYCIKHAKTKEEMRKVLDLLFGPSGKIVRDKNNA